MEITEWMIGDWVNDIEDERTYRVDRTLFEFWRKWEKIQPIPLAAEIFEKNGFVKLGRMYDYDHDDWIQKYRYGPDFEILYSTRHGFLWRGVPLRFVHELQHALRLWGINNLADNFKI